LQAKRRLKQQQQASQLELVHAASSSTAGAFSSKLGAVVALADSALRDINVSFMKTSSSEAAVAQMMCVRKLLLASMRALFVSVSGHVRFDLTGGRASQLAA
jgi:hypothetical protein